MIETSLNAHQLHMAELVSLAMADAAALEVDYSDLNGSLLEMTAIVVGSFIYAIVAEGKDTNDDIINDLIVRVRRYLSQVSPYQEPH